MKENTVTVNGTVYDKRTGNPLRVERGSVDARHPAHSVHLSMQKSRTLNRKYVKKDAARPQSAAIDHEPAPTPTISQHRAPAQPLVTRSESISRFAKDLNQSHSPVKRSMDIAPTTHHIAQRTQARHTATAMKPVVVAKPSALVKQQAIDQALSQAPAKRPAQHKSRQHSSPLSRKLSLASGALAILLLGAYFTYLNMPQLSTRVAAAQSGINATYPRYQPMGYSLTGPVAFDNGSVTMRFTAHGAPRSFTLAQAKSGWDSTAVLDSYVMPKAGENYTTTAVNGLTIYTFNEQAAWVNGGILYTIDGNAPLSEDQIQRIATSL